MKHITVLIPCFNEEEGVVTVLTSIPRAELKRQGFTVDAIVIDNNSTDRTSEMARKHGAKVIKETKIGKGNAMLAGFKAIPKKTDFVVMLDGDGSYLASEIPRMIEPLAAGFADVILGSRLAGKISAGSMSPRSRIGNWGFTFLVRKFVHGNVTDVLTGYFAWRREVTQRLHPVLVSEGFAIEMEMVIKMARMDYNIFSVPITYAPRVGESKLSPIRDGLRILKTYAKAVSWRPPKVDTTQ